MDLIPRDSLLAYLTFYLTTIAPSCWPKCFGGAPVTKMIMSPNQETSFQKCVVVITKTTVMFYYCAWLCYRGCLWLKHLCGPAHVWLQNMIFRTDFLHAICLCIWVCTPERTHSCQVFVTWMFWLLNTCVCNCILWRYCNRTHFTALSGESEGGNERKMTGKWGFSPLLE